MKNKKNIRIVFGIISIVMGISLLVFSYIEEDGIKNISTQAHNSIEENKIKTQETNLAFDSGSHEKKQQESIEVFDVEIEYIETVWNIGSNSYRIKTNKNTTAYDALVFARENNIFSFEGRNYPILGFFVEEIGELKMTRGKNLMYYINGMEASVGVSNYILQDGDIIEWKLN